MRNLSQSFTMRKDGRPPKGDWFKIQNLSSSSTEVMIYDEIGFWGTTADDFVKEIRDITTDEIHLRINSPGGRVFDGIAIFNALIRHDARVVTFVDALAASAASFIAQAGDEVHMAKGSTMMVHDGLAMCFGNEQDMLKTAQTLGKISNNIASIYADRAGGTVESWRSVMREEVWFTADEAVDANLADDVLSSADEEAQEATDKWDLEVFNYAGREKAPDPNLVRERIEVAAKESNMTRPKSTAVNDDNASTESTETEETQGTESGTSEEETAPPSQETGETGGGEVTGVASFQINGQTVTDPAAVQRHISSLENAQTETRDGNIQSFVEGLAKGDKPKILASQIDELVAFAKTLTSEQYRTWSASYESAPGQSVLAQTGPTAGEDAKPGGMSAQEAEADQVAVWEQTVKMHRDSGMTDEAVKRTASYKALEAHREAASNNKE